MSQYLPELADLPELQNARWWHDVDSIRLRDTLLKRMPRWRMGASKDSR